MQNSFVLSLVGFAIALAALVKGADYLVENASCLARRLRIPEMIIGLTIVACGTSLPELVVSVQASLHNQPGISFGNVIGSNTANILLILGICALIRPLQTDKEIKRDLKYFLASFLIFAGLVLVTLDTTVGWSGLQASLNRWQGVTMLAFFVYFVARIVWQSEKSIEEESHRRDLKPVFHYLLFLSLGLGMVIVGGHFTVATAISMARTMGISEAIIGLTLVAVGTSLPELVASVVAGLKGHNEIAIGNIVGSNIFNLAGILGLTMCLAPFSIDRWGLLDIFIMTLVSLALAAILRWRKKQAIGRYIGLLFLFGYVAYTWQILQR